MRTLILFAAFIATAAASVPVRDACAEDATIVANVPDSASIEIRHGMQGESVPCYAVSVAQPGGELRGFIIGSTLPLIQEFEKKLALESRIPLPTPSPSPSAAAAPGEKKAVPTLPAVGPPFETWTGTTLEGRRLQIGGEGKVTLVAFWSAESGSARRLAKSVMKTAAEFRPKGLRVVGVVQPANRGRINYFLEDMGLDYPLALDSRNLAAQYHANSAQGAVLILDQRNNVVLVSSDLAAVRTAMATLLAP